MDCPASMVSFPPGATLNISYSCSYSTSVPPPSCIYNHLTSKCYLCTHTSLPACFQYLFYCILLLYRLEKAPLQRCPRARTDSSASLSLSRQVRAEVDDITGRLGEYAHCRPHPYQKEVQCYAN